MERGLKYDCSLVKKLPEENCSGTPCYWCYKSNNIQALVAKHNVMKCVIGCRGSCILTLHYTGSKIRSIGERA